MKRKEKMPKVAQDKKKIHLNEESFIKDMVLYTPKRLKETVANYEVNLTKQVVSMFYMLCIVSGFVLAYSFALAPKYWVFIIFTSLFFAPVLMVEYLRDKNEQKKFYDINSYAQQFISGMQLKHKIIPAIENTIFTFPTGKMHDTLLGALRYIENSSNPLRAQTEALYYIDNTYPNMQTPMIHDFAKRIEITGGDFETEMNLLNEKREKWEKRIEHEQNQTKVSLVGAVIMYLVMLLVCLLILHALPPELDIKDYGFVQVAEMLVIMGLYPFLYSCIKNHRKGWMQSETMMSEEQAKEALDYLDNFNPKVERKKGYIAGMIAIVITILLFVLTRNFYVIIFGLILTTLGFNIHNIIKIVTLKKVQKEMTRAMPKWLFDVCLCMQKVNIVESIERSIKSAAPILRRDIEQFLAELNKNPNAVDPYLNFLLPYGIPNVNATMRALLSIQNGTGGDTNMQMQQLIKHSLNLLDELDSEEEEIRRLTSLKYTVTSTIPPSCVMLTYLIAIVAKVFDTMESLI